MKLPSIFIGIVPPGQKQLALKLNNPKVNKNIDLAYRLQRKLLAILASGAPLCNGSLDL